MKKLILLFSWIICISCSNTASDKDIPSETFETTKKKKEQYSNPLSLTSNFVKFNPKEIELEPIEDSIWYHLAYDLEGNGILTVAQPTKDTYEGVRLQSINALSNNEYEVLDESSPGYDSAMLFPTFFKNDENQIIILANTGTINSWGLKVYSLINRQFEDIGFIDMATIEKREFPDENGKMNKYGNIGPHIEITASKKGLTFKPTKENLIVFENHKKKIDVKFDNDEYIYILDKKEFKLKKN